MTRTRTIRVLILMGVVAACVAAAVGGEGGRRRGGGRVAEEESEEGGRAISGEGGGGVTEEKEGGRSTVREGGEEEEVEVKEEGKALVVGGGRGGEKEGRAITGGRGETGGGNTIPNIYSSTTTSSSSSSSSSSIPPKCFLPPEKGVCRAFLPSYYYNPTIGACDCFVYGGCRGNDNRFQTLDECMAECGVHQSAQQPTAECRKLFNEGPAIPALSTSTHATSGLSSGVERAVLIQASQQSQQGTQHSQGISQQVTGHQPSQHPRVTDQHSVTQQSEGTQPQQHVTPAIVSGPGLLNAEPVAIFVRKQ